MNNSSLLIHYVAFLKTFLLLIDPTNISFSNMQRNAKKWMRKFDVMKQGSKEINSSKINTRLFRERWVINSVAIRCRLDSCRCFGHFSRDAVGWHRRFVRQIIVRHIRQFRSDSPTQANAQDRQRHLDTEKGNDLLIFFYHIWFSLRGRP